MALAELSRQIAERMIALVQRVRKAPVTADDVAVGSIGRGLLIFPGIHSQDDQREADWRVRKCIRLRIFPDDAGQMNLSVGDLGADILPVSQLTLYGNVRKGHRPSFTEAACPAVAEPLYEYVKYRLSKELEYPVAGGSFGASMQVSPVNDGPVTIWMERSLEKTQNSRVSQTEIRQGYRPQHPHGPCPPVPQNNF